MSASPQMPRPPITLRHARPHTHQSDRLRKPSSREKKKPVCEYMKERETNTTDTCRERNGAASLGFRVLRLLAGYSPCRMARPATTASCINAFKTGELSHFGRTYHIVRFILYRGGWGRFLQNPDTPANRTEGWGRPALIECRHSDEASLFLEILACIVGFIFLFAGFIHLHTQEAPDHTWGCTFCGRDEQYLHLHTCIVVCPILTCLCIWMGSSHPGSTKPNRYCFCTVLALVTTGS